MDRRTGFESQRRIQLLIIDESDFEDGIRNRYGVWYRQTLNPIIAGRTVILKTLDMFRMAIPEAQREQL
ncbi:hypothetical protein AUH73_07470 [archaeon 13_1_40CM_4_53_4]|nr:MAG: hypothetical protein AUI07_09680 [archaeon 13_2_20CM_2_53_6]OLC61353.1 MAG: hypothetical protein AUH73_07470 [archaeon 13_1_40CM_4_53_4]OLE59098.1 MAG: hypothetical protein AUG17_04285 [Crenarchaeota archaeon 13_1_20CM_2_53_14]